MRARDALVLLAATLAVVRVTRFVTTDTLTIPARAALSRRFSAHERPSGSIVRHYWLVELIHCDWCVAVWASLAAAFLLHACGLLDDWRLVLLGWLAMAGGAGLLLDGVRR